MQTCSGYYGWLIKYLILYESKYNCEIVISEISLSKASLKVIVTNRKRQNLSTIALRFESVYFDSLNARHGSEICAYQTA